MDFVPWIFALSSQSCRWTLETGLKRAGRRLPSLCVHFGLVLILPLLFLALLRVQVAETMPPMPHTLAQNRRALERGAGLELCAGRPVTEATVNLRQRYWNV